MAKHLGRPSLLLPPFSFARLPCLRCAQIFCSMMASPRQPTVRTDRRILLLPTPANSRATTPRARRGQRASQRPPRGAKPPPSYSHSRARDSPCPPPSRTVRATSSRRAAAVRDMCRVERRDPIQTTDSQRRLLPGCQIDLV